MSLVAASSIAKKKGLVRAVARPASDSYWAMVARRFLRHRLAVTGLVILVVMVLAAIFAPGLAPHDPNSMDVFAFSAPPSEEHPLGTDSLGRDVLSRLLYASRISLSVGLGATLLNVLVGVLLGGIAGYLGGKVDSAIMRFTDMILSFPPLMIILVLVSVLGPSLINVILVLGLLGWPQICRLVRAEILKLKQQEFIMAARALGVPDRRILLRHLVPNTFPPVLVTATFGAAQAIIQEASLSFLGMGVQPPTASWGNLLTDAQSMGVLGSMPWLWLPPGLMIVVAVLSINFVGDGLRDALDPRLN